ncbi:MAG: FprA family A-type flavoprotein [Chitinispirillaceae bacterium]
MKETQIASDIFWVGVNDRTTDLFEGLWPLDGVGISYNSYVIKDEKNVLIDLSTSIKTDEFFEQISRIVDISKLDYVIINHMEPDHTGILKTLRMINNDFEIICTPKAVQMLENYYGVNQKIRSVQSGETVSIGKRQLQFHHVPFVHWPETMVTYDPKEKTLFSCDAFGGYGAIEGTLFDDECCDIAFYEKESLRYYANIVAKFSTNVLNAISKLGGLDIEIIAPSHGLIWRKNPLRIIELYREWAEYGKTGGNKGVTLLYGSMYGNTETMMNAVARGITKGGIHPEIFDVARTHASYILPSLWKNKGVIIGAPTYEVSLFPYMQQTLEKAVIKNVKNKKAAYFGSYGWSKGALKKVTEMTAPLDWEISEGFEFPGGVTPGLYDQGFQLGKRFAQAIDQI